MSSLRHNTERALRMLRGLPRVSLGNIRDNPGSKICVSFFVIICELFLLNGFS